MTVIAVARSSLATSLTRYARSPGLWLLMLIAPILARIIVTGSTLRIAVASHLPVMTSATLGVSLGIIVSTVMLPAAFIYLRSNTTRRQPWQVAEVTSASRVAITLGRFAADVTVLFGVLGVLTLAGCVLGWFFVTGPLEPEQIACTLWLIAAPALMTVAALHRLFDALPLTRRGLGDVLGFVFWFASLVMPALAMTQSSSFGTDMYDLPGYTRPMVGAGTMAGKDFSVGMAPVRPGRVSLDVMAGIGAPGYVASRFAWTLVAIMVAGLAGLLYRPHTASPRAQRAGRIARLVSAGPPKQAVLNAPAAQFSPRPFLGLIFAEFRLIGVSRIFLVLAVAAALLGLFGDFRHLGSPAALLLLAFGMSAHAGRSEAPGLLALATTARFSPAGRRAAFMIASMAWSLLLAIPAALFRGSIIPLSLAAVSGGATGFLAIALAAISRSAFAPRLVLLVLWYCYLST